ncbi:MAG: hypothetical protein ACK4PR_03640, partial [Gammaproteobacteria bacterium]
MNGDGQAYTSTASNGIFSPNFRGVLPSDNQFIDALNRLTLANNDTGSLMISLVEHYLKTPLYDKAKIVVWVRQHLAFLLQNSARNKKGQHILDIINSRQSHIDTSEGKQVIAELKNLLEKQYSDYLPSSNQKNESIEQVNDTWSTSKEISADDNQDNGVVKLAVSNGTDVDNSKEEMTVDQPSSTNESSTNYEEKTAGQAFIKSKTSAEIHELIKQQISSPLANGRQVAMNMMHAYLANCRNANKQLALLEGIHAGLHIYLRKDAKTTAGRTILHLLAMCDLQDQKAASITRTLLENFKPMRDNINHKSDIVGTALHAACWYGTPEVATVLLSFDAHPAIADNQGKLAKNYINDRTYNKKIKDSLNVLLAKPLNEKDVAKSEKEPV